MCCELGERLTDRYNHIDMDIFCSNWYIFPQNIQKVLTLFLNGIQEPVVLSGFGNLEWSRESFKNVSQYIK